MSNGLANHEGWVRNLFRCTALTVAVFAVAGVLMVMGRTAAEPARWTHEGWKTDFSKQAVEWSEIISGGPRKDGIPPIDAPEFVPIKEVTGLKDNEPVISVAIKDRARAYPIRVLMWHEIVNDTLSGVPIAVTYCPLCNAALVFKRNHKDTLLDFGTTGKLRNSDLVMYDRQTESWWQQFTGEAIVGTYTGDLLVLLPSRLESFALFKKRHSDGEVLVPNNPHMRPYGTNPYARYDTGSTPFLFSGELPRDIAPMARVVIARNANTDNRKKRAAIALDLLKQKKTMTVDGITYHWSPGQASALDTRLIADGFDVGNVWVTRKQGGRDVDVAYDLTFAFVYRAFNKDGVIITQ